jgi:hypothetical protein
MTTVKCVVNKHADVMRALNLLANTRVMVGVPAEHAVRNPEPGEKGAPPNNAELAYINEHGCPATHIPPRPFLKSAIAGIAGEIDQSLRRAAEYAMQGRPEAVEKSFMALGLLAQDAARKKINEGVPPPLSERTLQTRAARGRKGAKKELKRRGEGMLPSIEFAKPLIDTGQLRNAITFVIRKVRGLQF